MEPYKMKKVVTLIFAFLAAASVLFAQKASADDITGTWLTADKTGEITIYKDGSAYFGKITAGTSDQKFDIHNPDKARRNDPLIGLVILKDLEYKGENKWTEGSVYDPQNGKTYSCNLTLLDRDHLKITGYIGFSWIGRSEEWERIK